MCRYKSKSEGSLDPLPYTCVCYVSFQAIRHEKLNRPEKPCEPSPDYSFANCVEKSLATEVGCQPYWRRFEIEGLPVCNDWHHTMKYGWDYGVGKGSGF